MAEIKLSNLPLATSVSSSDLLLVVRGTAPNLVNNKLTVADLFANITSNVVIDQGDSNASLIVNGSTLDNLLNVSGTENRVFIGYDPLTGPETGLLNVNGAVTVKNTYYSSDVVTTNVGDTTIAIDNILTQIISPSVTSAVLGLNYPNSNQTQVKVISLVSSSAPTSAFNVQCDTGGGTPENRFLGITSFKLSKVGDTVTLISCTKDGKGYWTISGFSGSGVSIQYE